MADITYSTGTKKLEVDLPGQPQETGKNREILHFSCGHISRRKALAGVACLCLPLVCAVWVRCYEIFCFAKPDFWRTIIGTEGESANGGLNSLLRVG